MWPLAAFIWLFDIAAYQNFEITYTAFLNLFFSPKHRPGSQLQIIGVDVVRFRPVLGFAFYYYLLKNFDRQKPTCGWP